MTIAQFITANGRMPILYGLVDQGIYNLESVGQVSISTYNAALAVYNASTTAVLAGKIQIVPVSVTNGTTSGTATVVAGATILGITPAGNQDQFVNNVAISSTTLTVTLHTAATATNTYNVVVLNA